MPEGATCRNRSPQQFSSIHKASYAIGKIIHSPCGRLACLYGERSRFCSKPCKSANRRFPNSLRYKGSVDLADEIVGVNTPMFPLPIEIGSRMLGHHFAFRFTCIHQMLNTVPNGDNHVVERFNGSSICYFSSRRNNLDCAVSPRFERLQKSVECA